MSTTIARGLVLFEVSTEKLSIYDYLLCHLLMVIQAFAKILNLVILSNTGLEPWILFALRCFGGLVFFSIISALSLIRDPLPIDKATGFLSLCHIIGQLSVMILYSLFNSVNDINQYDVLLSPVLVFFGGLHEVARIIKYKSAKFPWKRSIYLLLLFCLIFLTFTQMTSSEYLTNKLRLLASIFFYITFATCKLFYYFGMKQINKDRINPFEVSASNIIGISKIGIPIGIMAHALKLKKLLPRREYTSFLIDLLRISREMALKVLLSSTISFGIVLPLQVISIPKISLMEYILYSIAPSIFISGNYLGIGLIIISLSLIVNNNSVRVKNGSPN
ncbi:putative integral membrane protein [Cryptosporidium felis]|nr:putative integral membrane protein [Cryptosporidium felis]